MSPADEADWATDTALQVMKYVLMLKGTYTVTEHK